MRKVARTATFGAGYGALRALAHVSVVPGGPLYGLGIYGLTLMGIGPVLGLTRGPWTQQPMTVTRRVMMHALYGTVTACVSGRVRRGA